MVIILIAHLLHRPTLILHEAAYVPAAFAKSSKKTHHGIQQADKHLIHAVDSSRCVRSHGQGDDISRRRDT